MNEEIELTKNMVNIARIFPISIQSIHAVCQNVRYIIIIQSFHNALVDSTGKVVKKFFEVKVNAKLANNSTLLAENIVLGQKVTANCLAQGGMGEYQYQAVYKQTSQSKWTTAQDFSENAVTYTAG